MHFFNNLKCFPESYNSLVFIILLCRSFYPCIQFPLDFQRPILVQSIFWVQNMLRVTFLSFVKKHIFSFSVRIKIKLLKWVFVRAKKTNIFRNINAWGSNFREDEQWWNWKTGFFGISGFFWNIKDDILSFKIKINHI